MKHELPLTLTIGIHTLPVTIQEDGTATVLLKDLTEVSKYLQKLHLTFEEIEADCAADPVRAKNTYFDPSDDELKSFQYGWEGVARILHGAGRTTEGGGCTRKLSASEVQLLFMYMRNMLFNFQIYLDKIHQQELAEEKAFWQANSNT